MDAFAVPLFVFTGLMVAMLVALMSAFEDPFARRAGQTWALTCPLSGLLFGVGLAPLAIITGVVSVLALGTLVYWFLVPESDDSDDDAEEPVEPDPGPSDDIVVEVPRQIELEPAIDWDEFDRVRADWEREREPLLPERV